MDTIKDRQRLEALHESGAAPWRVAGLPQAAPTPGALMPMLQPVLG